MKAIFQRVGMTLVPHGEPAENALRAIKDGALCVANPRGARNPEQLNLFMALCKLVADADDDTLYNVRKWVVKECGYVDSWYDKRKGVLHVEPKSIAEERMEQAEFNELFKKATEKLAERLGCTKPELMDRFNEMLADKRYENIRRG